MPSLVHEVAAGLLRATHARRMPHDEAGMVAEVTATALRPPHFAPPRSLDRHVALRVRAEHGWRVYDMAPWGPTLPPHRLVYFHGGGYVGEINGAHWTVCRRMSTLVPARVSVPIFPLAQLASAETTVPTAADIVESVLADAGDPSLVTVMGDSAGGGLALAAAQVLRDRGAPAARLVLIAPWLDVTMSDESIDEVATRDPVLSVARLRRAGRLYAGRLPMDDPRVSPINGGMHGLGPITVFVGTRDLLVHDSRRLRDEARSHGVPVDYHEAEGLMHVWPILPLPEARRVRSVMVGSVQGRRGADDTGSGRSDVRATPPLSTAGAAGDATAADPDDATGTTDAGQAPGAAETARTAEAG
jgi:acetyl esterase/lipase